MSRFALYPAIDVLGGKCVRLHQGDYAKPTVYSERPQDVAQTFLNAGATWLHVVDLDGAKAGSSVNQAVIREIVEMARACGAHVQVGGGIRTVVAVEAWLAAGVSRCVLGTKALDVAFVHQLVQSVSSACIAIGLDGRDGKLATNGWLEQTDIDIVQLAAALYDAGVRHALVTDVQRDGTSTGPNLALAQAVQQQGIAAIASGGIRDAEDVRSACEAGLAGAIAGRAIYNKTLDVAQTLAMLREVAGDADEAHSPLL